MRKTLLVFCSLIILCNIGTSQKDSHRHILNSQKDTNAVQAGIAIGKSFYPNQLDSMIYYYEKSLKLAKDLGYARGQVVIYRGLIIAEVNEGNYEQSMQNAAKGRRLVDSVSMAPVDKVDILINEGAAHYLAQYIGKAIESYIEAVEIARENNMDQKLKSLYLNLGVFYRNLDRYEEALEIYDQSIELAEKLKDTVGMAKVYFNKASVFTKIDQNEYALEILGKANDLYRAIDDQKGLKMTQIAKGSALTEMEKFEEAELAFLEAKRNTVTVMNPFNFNLNQGLATTQLRQGNYAQAERYLDEINEEVLSTKMTQQILRQHKLHASVYEQKGQSAKAYEALNRYVRDKEAIDKADRLSFRQEMETKFLTLEKENEIKLLSTQNALNELKLKSSNQRNWGLGIGLIIFAGLLTWLTRLWQKTKEKNIVISQANKDKEILIKEIHHRVKNNLQVVSSLLTLQSKFVKDNKALDAINIGKARVQSIAILHRSLYQNKNLKHINLRRYFHELTENLMNTYKMVYSDIEMKLDVDNIELDIDQIVPMGLIVNELVCNALKHAFPEHKGTIDLKVNKDEEAIQLSVRDNGMGIPFTSLEGRSETLGMQLVKSFAKKLQAEVNIYNQEGTVFELRFTPEQNLRFTAEREAVSKLVRETYAN